MHICSCCIIKDVELVLRPNQANIRFILVLIRETFFFLNIIFNMGNLFVCMASGSGDDRKDFDHMCHECVSQFGDNKGLEDHMKSLHKGKYKCFKCKRVFTTKEKRVEHLKNIWEVQQKILIFLFSILYFKVV